MTTSSTVIGDVVASNPPQQSIEAYARMTHAIPETQSQFEKPVVETDVEISSRQNSSEIQDPDRPLPTDEERKELRHVAGSIPWIAFALCFVEFAERASYYGATQVFNNFLQQPLPTGGNGAGAPAKHSEQPAGALGKGIQFASAFVLLFKFLAYTVPIFGGWLADTRIGRYPAIMIGVLICGVAHIIQIFGALPSVLQKGQGTSPFVISLFLLAIGAGIFKPNILPTVLDQYQEQSPYVTTLKSGERVIMDPEMTINRISLIFYCFVNIGGLFGIATAYAEKLVGFWLAFLLPGIIYFSLPILLLGTRHRTIRKDPDGSELSEFFMIISMALKRSKGVLWRKDFFESVKPSVLAAQGITTWKGKPIPWSDKLVDDVRRVMNACAMFLFFPVWYLNDGGIGVVATSQAANLKKNNATNDLLGNFNPLTIIFFVPLLTYVIYPTLERFNMMPGRVTRITFGFTLAWISSIIGALIQWNVYHTSPCGFAATKCKSPSPLSVWVQIPIFALGAMSECFCQVTAYEIAYARSPKAMRAVVMAVFLFMNALSSALALIITPAIKDPNLIWIWAGPAIAMFLISIEFYRRYSWMNSDEFMLEETGPEAEAAETIEQPHVKAA